MVTYLRTAERHLPYWITRCYLSHDTVKRSILTRAKQASTRFTYLAGWVNFDVGYKPRWFTCLQTDSYLSTYLLTVTYC